MSTNFSPVSPLTKVSQNDSRKKREIVMSVTNKCLFFFCVTFFCYYYYLRARATVVLVAIKNVVDMRFL